VTDIDQQKANDRMANKQIRADINRLLLSWDPLCVKGLRGADRQYEPQIPDLFVMIKKGAKYMEIARHLDKLLTQEWQLPRDKEKCVELGKKMYNIGAIYRGDELMKLS